MVLLIVVEIILMGYKIGNNFLNWLFYLLIFCIVYIDILFWIFENSDLKYFKLLFY